VGRIRVDVMDRVSSPERVENLVRTWSRGGSASQQGPYGQPDQQQLYGGQYGQYGQYGQGSAEWTKMFGADAEPRPNGNQPYGR
jgi:hypothetical protein